MASALAVVLFITCALSWNTAHGNALLGQLTAAQSDVASTQAQIATASGGDQNATGQGAVPSAAWSGANWPRAGGAARPLPLRAQTPGPPARPQTPSAPAAHSTASDAPDAPPPLVTTPRPFVRYCDQPTYLAAARGSDADGLDVFASPTQAKLCDDLNRKGAAVAAASANLNRWVNQLQWRWLLPASRAAPPPGPCDPDCKITRAQDADSQFASSLLGVLSGAVLPFLYGLLGAGAAVVRSLAAKLREWQLDPRDLLISFIQLALGAVLGACIGLFVTPAGAAGVAADTTSGAAASQGLLGPVHLSAAALCFIAGFFVEGVFKALEGLMNRVFSLNTSAPPAKS